jgi:hypothetical protein
VIIIIFDKDDDQVERDYDDFDRRSAHNTNHGDFDDDMMLIIMMLVTMMLVTRMMGNDYIE